MTNVSLMQHAISLAKKGRLTASPNPLVGCVIVKDGLIVGEGFHLRAGEAHAEINALKQAGDKAKGAHAFVSLEPCCHYGRTPPCTKALIEAGIKQVTIATLDPNPLVSGKGIEELEAKGIRVTKNVCQKEAEELNEIYFHYRRFNRPFVIAKWAMSLDGKTITNSADRKITSEKSQVHVHELRSTVDAILIGANTAREDNPLLTVRLTSQEHKQPIRIILTKTANLPMNLNIFDKNLPSKTLVATTKNATALQTLNQNDITINFFESTKEGSVDLSSFLDHLGQQGITSLLVEGGMQVHEQFFKENLVDRAEIYIAPIFIGQNKEKLIFKKPAWGMIENDLYCQVRCR